MSKFLPIGTKGELLNSDMICFDTSKLSKIGVLPLYSLTLFSLSGAIIRMYSRISSYTVWSST